MSSPKFQCPKGTHDILPDDQLYFTFIKKVVRHRCREAGFRRITTPHFENVELFTHGLGNSTDVVEKEMFVFESKSGKKLALKPEGTAGVVRAYLQHGMQQLPSPVALYYVEPHFRYSRPQKGRYRQFHQFGFELIGESDPAIDAQIIYLAYKINQDLGIAEKLNLQINTIGCSDCRKKYKEELINFYTGKERSLCEDCKNRLNKNPLRLLDCKEEDCQIIASMAPKLSNVLCEGCKEHYNLLKEFLDELNVPYTENQSLVRGLDYYSRTVFEFWSKSDGSQNATGGGGRYDGLVELMGGQDTPAIGYAAGVERTIEYMKESGIRPPNKDRIHVFIAQLGHIAKKRSLSLLNELREKGLNVVGSAGKASIKSQMRVADRLKAKYALILGQIEVQEGTIILRDMDKGSQETISIEGISDLITEKIGVNKLDKRNLWEE